MRQSLLRLAVLSGAVLTLGACASMEPTTTFDTASPSDGAPLPIADHDWFLFGDEGETVLTYGRAESDDVWLTLLCTPGSGQLELMRPADSDRQPVISLESGGDTERFRGRIEPSELFEHGEIYAEARAGHPVFLRFRRVGWLAQHDAEGRAVMVAHTGSEDRIESFFSRCG